MYEKTLQKLFVLSVILISLSGCSENIETKTPLKWTACDDDATTECASVDVARNYDRSADGRINLNVRRKPAPALTRKGVLIVHLGGQEGAGNDAAALVESGLLPASLLKEYDIVSFDAHGTGDTANIDCDEFVLDVQITYPTTQEELLAIEAQRTKLANDCSMKEGDYLVHNGSHAAVTDMENIRLALGENKLNFLGLSFGTRMGSLYMQRYPQTTGKFVLDAAVPSDSSLRKMALLQLAAMQSNLEFVLSDCARIDSACNPVELLSIAEERMDTLIAEKAQREFDLFLGMLLFSTDIANGELVLGPLVDYLQNRDFEKLETIVGPFFDENLGPVETDTPNDLAIFCADDAARPNGAALIDDLAAFNQVSNLFAEHILGTFSSNCVGWPAATKPLAPIMTDKAPQALVIGGTSDAVTPIKGSQELATAIGAYFLESSHTGHSVAYLEGNKCVDDTVTEFLITGLQPTVTECAAP